MSRNKQQNKNKIVKMFNENPITSSVCKKANVPRSTFYRWLEEDIEFKKQVDVAVNYHGLKPMAFNAPSEKGLPAA